MEDYLNEIKDPSKKRLKKLDGLRGLFALMVVLYHFEEVYLPYNSYNFFLVRQSNSFVDFFFVLSGFVISLNYESFIDSSSKFTQYIKKRFIRLYPLLFFTTSIFIVYLIITNFIKVLIPSISIFENSSTINFLELIYSSLNTFLMTNSTPILGLGRGVNYPSWSISSEMISYLIYGFIFLFPFLNKIKIRVLFTILCVSFLLYNGSYYETGGYGFVRGFLCFNMGNLVYLIFKLKFKIGDKTEILILPLIISFFLLLDLYNGSDNFIFVAIFNPLIYSISILIFSKTNYYISKFLELPFFQFLGKISFSVYLNHALLLLLY